MMIAEYSTRNRIMKFKVLIHEADEGGYWAEVPALPGCYSQAETMDEMLDNIKEAIACHLDQPLPDIIPEKAKVEEVEL
jgi:predicted RNase H-like HicB family nuclease